MSKQEKLASIFADINADKRMIALSNKNDSDVYFFTFSCEGLTGFRTLTVGDIDEAIAFARGVKAALEVL